MITTPESRYLVSEIEKVELWIHSQDENPASASEIYTGWSQLSAAFVSFLRTKLAGSWSDAEQDLVAKACRCDWRHHKLFSVLPESERVEFMLLPYSDLGARMHMLVSARHCKLIEMEVALFYFKNDSSEAIREEALVALASGGWPEAEVEALKLWKSRKTVRRMVALDCLDVLHSPLLDEYIEKAVKSKDANLRRYALAISSVKNMDKMNWPKPLRD